MNGGLLYHCMICSLDPLLTIHNLSFRLALNGYPPNYHRHWFAPVWPVALAGMPLECGNEQSLN